MSSSRTRALALTFALTAPLAAPLAAAGCGGGTTDPFTADLRMICSAADRHRGEPPELRTVSSMRDIADKIKTPEAARLMVTLMEAAPAERAALLAPALERAKLSRCPTLEP
jgi:hypothetical protein